MALAVCVLIFPVALMGLALCMAWLEQRVSLDGLHRGLGLALDQHDADTVEAYVTRGFGPALEHYWFRQAKTRSR